ncbi:MAG: hypothetical protein O3B04_01865 [Chloroflexi bacterium]|nr:hypothetical protein [Chloroflexota bacterium]
MNKLTENIFKPPSDGSIDWKPLLKAFSILLISGTAGAYLVALPSYWADHWSELWFLTEGDFDRVYTLDQITRHLFLIWFLAYFLLQSSYFDNPSRLLKKVS